MTHQEMIKKLHDYLWIVRAWIIRNNLESDFDVDNDELTFKEIEKILSEINPHTIQSAIIK